MSGVDLAQWLTAQLDTDERIARAATPGPWRHNPDKHWRRPGTSWFEEGVFAGAPGEGAICVAGTGETDDPPSMADAAHIAAHDPARVLREVDLKRQIIARYEELRAASKEQGLIGDLTEEYQDFLLRLLTLPYADRDGYRPEWAPSE